MSIISLDQNYAIHNADWDILIILDACRYDYFKKHTEYDTEEAHSSVDPSTGYATTTWLQNTWPHSYDLTYISATPRVNSVTPIDGYNATRHFTEIVDVWNTGWDRGIGTVRPNVVTNEAYQYHRDKSNDRLVVHYLQPHEPYLDIPINTNKRNPNPASRSGLQYHLKRLYGGPLSKWLGHDTVIRLCEEFGLEYVNQMHQIVSAEGKDALLGYYADNLSTVVESVNQLLNRVDGRVVVTSDHGEYLGEDGYYGHSYVPNHDVITTVPWSIIE